MYNLDYKLIDVSLKNKDPKLIKMAVQLSKDELSSYKLLIMNYQVINCW